MYSFDLFFDHVSGMTINSVHKYDIHKMLVIKEWAQDMLDKIIDIACDQLYMSLKKKVWLMVGANLLIEM